jgi:hypothetical protein
MRDFVLVPSPFLGPFSWGPIRAELVSLGCAAQICDIGSALCGGPGAYQCAAQLVAGLIPCTGAVVVAHSGAGALAPTIAQQCGPTAAGFVLVDGLWPHPCKSWLQTVPAAFAEQLEHAASDGLAPPWSNWFDPAVLTGLLPDAGMREALVCAMPRAPMSFLGEPAPEAPDLDPDLCGYLQLSAAYGVEAARARAAGWTSSTLALDHLAILTAAAEVAEAILGIAKRFKTHG